jgi:hypothetical protein
MPTAIASSSFNPMFASSRSFSTKGKSSWLAPADTNSCRRIGDLSPKDKATEHQAVEVSMAKMRVNLNSF